MPGGLRDVGAMADPVAEVLAAYAADELISLRTSGSSGRPRSVIRTAASWVDSFPAVSRLTGIDSSSVVWVPGPYAATMNLFAAVHARWAGAAVTTSPEDATHAVVTPAVLARSLDEGTDLGGRHVVVAGDRLSESEAGRARAAGIRTSHYYGAAELSFVAWGSHDRDLQPFPGVEVAVRNGELWARSPYLCRGYDGEQGPLRLSEDGFATVGDRGRLVGGVLTVTGRGTGTIVTAGATVHAADVESVLRDASGRDVVVVGVQHSRLGEIVAAVVPEPDAYEELLRAARARLDRPRRPVWWFHVGDLPLTSAGKVDRGQLAVLISSGSVPRLGTSDSTAGVG